MFDIMRHSQSRCAEPAPCDVPVGTVILAGRTKTDVVAFVYRGGTDPEREWETPDNFYTDAELNEEMRDYPFVAVILPEAVQVIKESEQARRARPEEDNMTICEGE